MAAGHKCAEGSKDLQCLDTWGVRDEGMLWHDVPLAAADLVILLERGGNALVQQLAEDLAHEQSHRSASATVGARFREQLRDLIARLDRRASPFLHRKPHQEAPLRPQLLLKLSLQRRLSYSSAHKHTSVGRIGLRRPCQAFCAWHPLTPNAPGWLAMTGCAVHLQDGAALCALHKAQQ